MANGSGPTLLALGGNHGDEYEGPVALMNADRIIQEGTPREVYSRPASVFASGFISEANLIQGTVVKTEDIIVTLPTGEGKHVKAKSSLSLGPGTRAIVSVRPEAIRVTIEESPESLTSGVSGTVADIVYVGSRIRIGLETSDEVVVWADLRDEEGEGLEEGLRGAIGRFAYRTHTCQNSRPAFGKSERVEQHGQTEQKPVFDRAALEIVDTAWKEVG